MTIKEQADSLLRSATGRKLKASDSQLQALADSAEGQRVRKMIEGQSGGLQTALESGDMESVRRALSGILQTKEGAQLTEQLKRLIQ